MKRIVLLLVLLLALLPVAVFAQSLDEVVLSKSTVYIGQYDFSLLSVRLTDTSGKPLAGRMIRVYSSRLGDVVKPYRSSVTTTDSHGMVAFAVTSPEAGYSDYSVFDETSRRQVGKPVRVYYLDAKGVGGDVLAATTPPALSTESGPAENLVFEDLSTTIPTNQPVDFTVSAQDTNKKTSSSYRGTVHFSALGDNGIFVSLPKDYTYTSEDLGKHVFPLSLVFQQEGTYLLQVVDVKQSTLIGSTSVTVKGGSSAASSSANKVAISTPSPGSYRTSAVSITGSSPAGKDVKIFDNDQEIASTVAKIDGTFSYTTTPLPDGRHELSAKSLDQKGVILGTSEKVTLTIDTQPPTIVSVGAQPAFDVSPSQLIQIELQSESRLKKALVDVSGVVSELTEDLEKSGLYHGSFASPDKEGEYALKFTLADLLGNEAVLFHETKLVVHTAGLVQAVANLKATAGDFRVTLSWDAPSRGRTNIDHYRIYYGTDPNNLTQKMDTPDDNPQWYVPNLKNGTQYYFGVVAVDKQGSLGEAGTLAIAVPIEGSISGFPVADSYISSRYLRGETGPEVFWLLPLSYALYRGGRKFFKK